MYPEMQKLLDSFRYMPKDDIGYFFIFYITVFALKGRIKARALYRISACMIYGCHECEDGVTHGSPPPNLTPHPLPCRKLYAIAEG